MVVAVVQRRKSMGAMAEAGCLVVGRLIADQMEEATNDVARTNDSEQLKLVNSRRSMSASVVVRSADGIGRRRDEIIECCGRREREGCMQTADDQGKDSCSRRSHAQQNSCARGMMIGRSSSNLYRHYCCDLAALL